MSNRASQTTKTSSPNVLVDPEEAKNWWDYEKPIYWNFGHMINMWTCQWWGEEFGKPGKNNPVDVASWNQLSMSATLYWAKRDEPRFFKEALTSVGGSEYKLVMLCQRDNSTFEPYYSDDEFVKGLLEIPAP